MNGRPKKTKRAARSSWVKLASVNTGRDINALISLARDDLLTARPAAGCAEG